jgi:hypothetical protein
MKLTAKQLIQTICDLMDGNCDPGDIRRETGWDIEKSKELSDIVKACLNGEVEVEDNKATCNIQKAYAYVSTGYESFDKTKHIDDYDMGMYRGFYLVKQRLEDLFPELKPLDK